MGYHVQPLAEEFSGAQPQTAAHLPLYQRGGCNPTYKACRKPVLHRLAVKGFARHGYEAVGCNWRNNEGSDGNPERWWL